MAQTSTALGWLCWTRAAQAHTDSHTRLGAMQTIFIDPSQDAQIVRAWSSAVESTFWPSSHGRRRAFYANFPAIRVAFMAPESINSAIQASVSSSYGLVAAAVLAICAFTIAVLFVRGRAFERTLLGIVGLVSVTLSIGAGFGTALFIGLPFTTVTQVLPFILLGVGVDDMFMLVQSLEEVDETMPGLPLQARAPLVLLLRISVFLAWCWRACCCTGLQVACFLLEVQVAWGQLRPSRRTHSDLLERSRAFTIDSSGCTCTL
jgi:Patched family